MLSDHFNLSHIPFADDADLNGLFQCPEFDQAYDDALMGVLDGRAVQVVIGSRGLGRTTLLTRLVEGLQSTEFECVSLARTDMNVSELISALLRAVTSLPTLGVDATESQEELASLLAARRAAGSPILIVIDDAEHLGAPVLNQLPRLVKDESGEPLAQIILTVTPKFGQRLTGIELDRLNAAIDGIVQLEPWDRTTVTDYVCANVELAAGVAGQLFAEDALEAIYRHSRGVPYHVSRLCSGALLSAYERGKKRVSLDHVNAAAEDIMKTPSEYATDDQDQEDWDDDMPLGELNTFTAGPPLARTNRARAGISNALGGVKDKLRGAGTALASLPARLRPARKTVDEDSNEESIPELVIPPSEPSRSSTRTILAGAGVLSVAGVVAVLVLLNPFSSDAMSEEDRTTVQTFKPSIRITEPPPSVRAMGASDSATSAPQFRQTAAQGMTSAPQVSAGGVDQDRQARQIEALTEAVRSLSRTLVSVEARLRRFDSDIGELRASVHSLKDAPRTVVASNTTRAPRASVVKAPSKSASRSSGGQYTVKAGDTLWAIANREGTTIAKLATLNGLRKDAPLRTGQKLRLTGSTSSAPAKKIASASWYTVQQGDSLYSIGKRFAVAPSNLATWNCLTKSKSIFPGQRISIAASNQQCSTHQG